MVGEDYPRVVAEFKAPSALNALPCRKGAPASEPALDLGLLKHDQPRKLANPLTSAFNLRRAVRGLEGLQVRIGEADPVVDDGEARDGFNRWPSGHTRQLVLLDSVHMHLNAALLSRILKAEAILNRVDAIDDGL